METSHTYISGAGGGGGKGRGAQARTPYNAPDSLDSTQYATVIDLISEGEIQGLKDGLKSIFLNNTPLASSSATGTFTRASASAPLIITIINHGYTNGQQIYVDAYGNSPGYCTVANVTANTFTVAQPVALSGYTWSSGAVTTYVFNFQNVTVYTRNGTQSQPYIPTSGVSNTILVNTAVTTTLPVTRTISDTAVTRAKVTIAVPALFQQKTNGDLVGTSINLQIQVQYNNGGFTTVIDDTITGRTNDQYDREYNVPITGGFPVDIRVVRITADSNTTNLVNAFTWSTYTEITDAKLRYPNSALIGLRINAEQFSSIPERTYLIRGIKVSIPINATVNATTGSLLYTGTWNGTFGAAQWTSDPAWVLFDLLTSTRYGFGDHIQASQLDKWAFYSASQYCAALNTYNTAAEIANRAAIGLPPRTGATDDYNSMTGKHGVPNGLGGYEPRFSCNVNIQNAEEAYTLINSMCSVFRAMPFWSAGALTINQDKSSDPSFLFTLANVTEEGFTYETSSRKGRPTVAVVKYLDIASRDVAYEVVEDAASIAKYGVVTTQVDAFACTSRSQAARIGKWLLYSEAYEGEVVSFTTSIDAGVVVRPGQIISISDPVRAGSRRGGRIRSATASAVTIDDATGLPASGGTLNIIMPDGTVQSRTVGTRSGTTVPVTTAFTTAPNANSIWIWETNDLQASTWRVLAIQEQDAISYTVTAISYNASKYAYIESNAALTQRDITNLNQLPASPTNLVFTEQLYQYQNQVRAKVVASWRPVLGVNEYSVQYRKDKGNWVTARVQGPDYEVLDITPGLFEFRIFSLSASGKQSTVALTGSLTALGKTAPPANVPNFTATIDPNIGVLFSWTAVTDLDIASYEIRTANSNWGTVNAAYVTNVTATTYKLGLLNPSTTTYYIKAIDTSGIYSTTAASTTVTITAPSAVQGLSNTVANTSAVLTWTPPATGSYAVRYYAIIYDGNTIATSNTTSFSIPVTWAGSRTYSVKAIDRANNEGPASNTTVTVAQSAAPSGLVANYLNDMLELDWNDTQGTLPTIDYEIRRGATYATSTFIAYAQASNYKVPVSWTSAVTHWVNARSSNKVLGTAASVTVFFIAPLTPVVTATFRGEQVELLWTNTPGSIDISTYEIRTGATYNVNNTPIASVKSTSFKVKVDWSGSQNFWVTAVDVKGNRGAAGFCGVDASVPAAPTSLTAQVVDNNVLLRWQAGSSVLPIVYYNVYRGGVLVGNKQGLFTTVFETASGTYTYTVAGVNSAGFEGAQTSIAALVNQPPDYVLRQVWDSTFSGTKTNTYVDNATLLVSLNTTETWQQHFVNNSWTTPQAQVNAGYPRYIMPTPTTASYSEIFDYGATITGTKITVIPTTTVITGTVTATPTISISTNNSTWTDYVGVSEIYAATSFRYVKVTYNYTSVGGDDLLRMTSLTVRLDSRSRNDAGTGTALASDSGGTTVNFNVAFVDVESITVTPNSTTPLIAIYDFAGPPNPTSFKVLLYTTAGVRSNGSFSWSARGV